MSTGTTNSAARAAPYAVIVGLGVTGLSCAHFLHAHDRPVTPSPTITA